MDTKSFLTLVGGSIAVGLLIYSILKKPSTDPFSKVYTKIYVLSKEQTLQINQ